MRVLLLLLLLPVQAAGQGWVIDASAGAARYEAVAGEVGSVNAILGIHHEGPRWAFLQGGVPFDSGGVPWLSAGGGGRWSRPVRAVEVGMELGAIGYGYRVSELGATGGGATLIGLPFVSFSHGPAALEIRSGVLHHTSLFEGDRAARTVHDNGAVATWLVEPRLLLEAEGRVVRERGEGYPFAGLRADLVLGQASLWGRAGRWFADALDDAGWGIGASYSLPHGVALRAEYQQQTDDPLYWNGPRTGWTLGVSRALGGGRAFARALAVPPELQQPAGAVTLHLAPGEAEGTPSVAGDFTDWQAVPMRRVGDRWEATFQLEPGVYHYSFVAADGSWFLPAGVPNRVDDGFGGTNAILVVGP